MQPFQSGPIVLFLDHFHRFVGGEDSPFDASALLKLALHYHEIQLIGTCTLEQYCQHIEHNAPVHRCCQPFFTPEAEQKYRARFPRRNTGAREELCSYHTY